MSIGSDFTGVPKSNMFACVMGFMISFLGVEKWELGLVDSDFLERFVGDWLRRLEKWSVMVLC